MLVPRLQHAGSVAQNAIATLETTRRWLPPAIDSSLQQLIRVGLAGPDGDRRQGAESGGIESQVPGVGKPNEDIVSVLVHSDDVIHGDWWFRFSAPLQDLLQHRKCAEYALQGLTRIQWQPGIIMKGEHSPGPANGKGLGRRQGRRAASSHS
jgi:hypothetical protein